jgi:nicotinate-nucleotide adenylyltransferase
MNILILGGTFDPPHLAHTTMVQTILDRRLFDEVWYLPVGHHHSEFFDIKKMTPIADRLKMLQLVLVPRTRIELYEVETVDKSYTLDTLRALQILYPAHKFSFLMGSDQLTGLHLWLKADKTPSFPEALNEFDFYIYPRQGYPLDLPYQQLKIIDQVEPQSDSSTEIRRRIKNHESITGLVDPQVENYIQQHQLYAE